MKKEALIASDWDSLRELAKPLSKRVLADDTGVSEVELLR